MWNNYFFNIQKKYSMRLSTTEPLVIRLDGKDITRNKNINLIENSDNSFTNTIEKTVKYFTERYQCYSIFGSDEVSFIFTEPMKLIEDLGSDKSNYSNEVISVFSQYFFQYFNHFDKNKIVFWHAKCFSICKEKIASYIKYRSKVIENVMVTYFLKRNGINLGNMKLEDKIEKCKLNENYNMLEKYQKGIAYYDGNQINLEDFLNGQVTPMPDDRDMKYLFSDLIDE